jgi:hypothetical protein
MPDLNETLATYENISEEVRVALELVGIKFWGYRHDHLAYQFIDTTLWRNWFVDLDDMHDHHIKSMMDSILEYRARSAARSS